MAARHSFSSVQGLTPMEAAVMEMHDGGASLGDIATALGKPVGAVRKVIYTYSDRNEEQRARSAATKSSLRLLIAQLRHGQHDLPGEDAFNLSARLAFAGAVQ